MERITCFVQLLLRNIMACVALIFFLCDDTVNVVNRNVMLGLAGSILYVFKGGWWKFINGNNLNIHTFLWTINIMHHAT